MKTHIFGTVSYQIITDSKVFWENDFLKAKERFDYYKKKKKLVKLILEHWEGEIGGTGVHSEEILYE